MRATHLPQRSGSHDRHFPDQPTERFLRFLTVLDPKQHLVKENPENRKMHREENNSAPGNILACLLYLRTHVNKGTCV